MGLGFDSPTEVGGKCHTGVADCLASVSKASHCPRGHFHSSSQLRERESETLVRMGSDKESKCLEVVSNGGNMQIWQP